MANSRIIRQDSKAADFSTTTTNNQDTLENGRYPISVAMASRDPRSVRFSPEQLGNVLDISEAESSAIEL